jgi:hypothetical protein
MLDFWSFWDVLRKPKPDPCLQLSEDFLYDEGLTMGTLYIGRQGTGKTSSLGLNIFDYFTRHPKEAIFILDWSGSITDSLLKLILQDPDHENMLNRVIYDDMGNPEIMLPLPEFSDKYGDVEDRVQKVSQNLARLAPELTAQDPVVGGLAIDNATHFFKVATAITNEYNESWQITEVKRLMYDLDLLRLVVKKFGGKVPEAKNWLENSFMKNSNHDRFLQTMAVISRLNALEAKPIRARIGYYQPAWTPKEAIDKGLLVICDGARLINQEAAQFYLFMQVYSLIMEEINRRRPANPNDLPVSLVLDEVYSLLSIPGMANEISRLSPQYRSRKLQLYIVLQELAQVSRDLRPHIWSLGNVVSFAISNHDEAFEIAQQLFWYDPYQVKVGPTREGQHPLMETDRGQYLQYADWIQRLQHRQCIMRRYISEHMPEEKIQFIYRTSELPKSGTHISMEQAKKYLLRDRGVRVREALDLINQRTLSEDMKRPGL